MNKKTFKSLMCAVIIGLTSINTMQAHDGDPIYNHKEEMLQRAQYYSHLLVEISNCANQDGLEILNETAKKGSSALEKLIFNDVIGLECKMVLEYIKNVYIKRFNDLAEKPFMFPHVASSLYVNSLVEEFGGFIRPEMGSSLRNTTF